jgi:hypothetical protein
MGAPIRKPPTVGRIILAYALALCVSAPMVAKAAPDEASTSPAGERVLAIPPFAIEGKLPAAVREQVESDLVEAVRRTGFEVVPPKDVATAFGETPCKSEGCVTELGSKTGATHVLQVWIEQDGRDYMVRMILSESKRGSDVATFAQSCDICGVVELGDLIVGQSASLRDKLAVTPATLIIQTSPKGAIVRMDGGVLGTTPLRQQVSPGQHVVEIEKRGFHPMRRELSLVEGDEETLALELVEMEDAGELDEKRDLTKSMGWASFGLGLGLVGGGVPLLVLHQRPVKNRCDGDNVDENGLCRYRYTTLIPGAVLAGVGGALVVTGIALVAVHAKRKRGGDDARRRAQVSIGLTEVGVAVSF